MIEYPPIDGINPKGKPMLQSIYYRILDENYEPDVTENGLYILRFRYLVEKADGEQETPVEMFRRVAWNLAGAERVFNPELTDDQLLACAERFFVTMTDFKYLPNAPTLLGAGTGLQQLSACYVLPISDSIEGIFDTLRMTAVVHSKGSGTGFSFSGLRGRGSRIATGGKSTGPVSFMQVFDSETEVIKSGGTGWGANMGVLRCDHPDVLEFVRAKSSGSGLQNFNISVGVTDEFMRRTRTGGSQELIDPVSGEVVGEIDAKELFNEIAAEAWSTGDPGLLFLDQIEKDNPTPSIGTIEATNPCGEAPLLPFEACWLGGINLDRHYDEVTGDVDWTQLRETCMTAAQMMDNAIEMSSYPLVEIEQATKHTRKVGIGVMGFADLLIRMGLQYGSDESAVLAKKLMSEIKRYLDEATKGLAEERGVFPAFGDSVYALEGADGRRNATVTANAPNSTISAIAGCSSGIEPLFSLSYFKRLANGDRLNELNRELLARVELLGLDNKVIVDQISAGKPLSQISEVPDELREIFVTAHDIPVENHIRIQAAFQESTDLAVAKTINLNHSATVEDVKTAFYTAYEFGCKGITCFRDGCREESFLEPSCSVESQNLGSACTVCA